MHAGMAGDWCVTGCQHLKMSSSFIVACALIGTRRRKFSGPGFLLVLLVLRDSGRATRLAAFNLPLAVGTQGPWKLWWGCFVFEGSTSFAIQNNCVLCKLCIVALSFVHRHCHVIATSVPRQLCGMFQCRMEHPSAT
jgi:hypothetical protein